MTKTKKILLAIFIPLAASLVIAYVILYFIFPEEVQMYSMQVWEWLNCPLPIVSVSGLTIALIVWRLIASSSFGKKRYNQLKAEYLKLKEEYEENKEEYERKIAEIKDGISLAFEELDNVGLKLKESCMANPNKKIKQIGESIHVKEREETAHDETTAN